MAQAVGGWLLALLLLAGCADSRRAETEQCLRALAALEPSPVVALRVELPVEAPDSVVLHYHTDAGPSWQTCSFTRSGLLDRTVDLVAVRSSEAGELSPIGLFLLKSYGLGVVAVAEATADRLGSSRYLLQQLVNAVTPAAIYALLAIGYALIYGIIGRINLAFGEATSLGAYAALSGLVMATTTAPLPLALALGLGLGMALLAGGALGGLMARLVFLPAGRRGSQAALIATIGVALVLSEGLRLLSGSRQHWLPPVAAEPLVAWQGVTLGVGQAIVAGLALVLGAGTLLLLRRTGFGRAYRACADDLAMAALAGVDPGRTIACACLLGSALAGAAGFVVALHYGVIGFATGTLLGLKALTAAVVGGIGSAGGAALGGVLIGVLETLWAAYLPGDYRDVALFTLLALTLALRPHGLLGQPAPAEHLGLSRGRPVA